MKLLIFNITYLPCPQFSKEYKPNFNIMSTPFGFSGSAQELKDRHMLKYLLNWDLNGEGHDM